MADERQQDRYAEIFEHAPIARLITDESGTVREANRNAAELFALAPASLVGTQLGTFVIDEDREAFESRLRDAAGTTSPETWLMWFRPDRQAAPFRAEIHVVASRTDVGHLHWAISDVTKRTAMEQELRSLTSELETRVHDRTRQLEEERARLLAVIEQIPAGLAIFGDDGSVVMANAQARELLGDRLEEEIDEGRTDLRRGDGSQVALEVSTAPIVDADGNRVGAVRLVQDVSAREKQERAEREFVTNAAHQLQSPLAGILSAVDVLQAGAKDGPERDVFLGHIERESHRLARLARALLVLARAQTEYEAPRDELVAVQPLLTETCEAIQPAAGVSIEIACPDGLAVVTNRELVEQALMNVADNAAKYTKEGTISLSARPLESGVELEVSDTGPGILGDEQERVLERFYRSAGNGPEGFGLGFAIVRSAVEALDGELEIAERDEGGTAVRIRLGRAASLVDSG
jgi:PAS domain S-box-containing protein